MTSILASVSLASSSSMPRGKSLPTRSASSLSIVYVGPYWSIPGANSFPIVNKFYLVKPSKLGDKDSMRALPSVLSVLFLTLAGCADNSMREFETYSGQQPSMPVGDGSFSHEVQGIAIFTPGNYPTRAYTVLGKIRAVVVYMGGPTLEQQERKIAKACKAHGADAALVKLAGHVGNQAQGYDFWLIRYTPDIFDQVADATNTPPKTGIQRAPMKNGL